jgi:hypothetical protein
MRYVPAEDSPYAMPTIELTRRNLEILLKKLDDPLSKRTIQNDGWSVTAVEDIPRDVALIANGHAIMAVENEAHYQDRPPGEMYMPSTGEIL